MQPILDSRYFSMTYHWYFSTKSTGVRSTIDVDVFIPAGIVYNTVYNAYFYRFFGKSQAPDMPEKARVRYNDIYACMHACMHACMISAMHADNVCLKEVRSYHQHLIN